MTALQDELRKKYKTPAEAAAALGIDLALVMDAAMATDPPVSEQQRKAMWAAAEGRSTLGIPEKVGKEFVGKDTAMKRADDKKTMDIAKVRVGDVLPKAAMDALKASMDSKAYDEFCAKDWDPDEAEDEHEDDKSEPAKDRKAKDKAMDAKGAKDKKAKDSEEEEPEEVNEGKRDVKQTDDKKAKDSDEDDEDGAMDKHAMDEAIRASGKAVEKAVTSKFKGLYEAAEFVAPYIGKVDPMAFDSGEDIIVHANEKMGVKDAKLIGGGPAGRAVLGYQRKAGAHPVEHTSAKSMTMDEGTRADATKYAPGLAKITIGA